MLWKWMSVWKSVWFMFFYTAVIFLLPPLLTLAQHNNITALLFPKVLLHFINNAILENTLDVFSRDRRADFVTGTKVIQASHAFKNKVWMKTVPYKQKKSSCSFYLFYGSFFYDQVKFYALMIRHEKISIQLVLFCRGSNLRINFQPRLSSCWHRLTQWVLLEWLNQSHELIDIDWLFSEWKFVNECFMCEHNRRSINLAFVDLFQQVCIAFSGMTKNCIWSFCIKIIFLFGNVQQIFSTWIFLLW